MNIRKALRRAASVVALSACAASPVLAKESGFYLGVNAGQAKYDVDTDEIGVFPIVSGTRSDDTDVSLALSAGYRFNPYIGIEFSFIDLGDLEMTETGFITTTPSLGGHAHVEAGASGPALALVGSVPAGNFEFFGRVGTMYADAQINSQVVSTFGQLPLTMTGVEIVSSETMEMMYAVGVGYTFADEFFLKLEWMRVASVGDEDELGTEEVDVDVISVGFQYRF